MLPGLGHGFDLLAQRYQNHVPQLTQLHTHLITTGFLSAPHPDRPPTSIYNILLRSTVHHGRPCTASPALHLFSQMLSTSTPPSALTFPPVLKSLSTATAPSSSSGLAVHAQVVRRGLGSDGFIGCCLIKYYGELGRVRDARTVFEEMPERDLVSCNAMLDVLFRNGEIGPAALLFEGIREKDVVSWTTVIDGFVTNRRFEDAIRWFGKMVGVETPNEATLVCALSACANSDGSGSLKRGREIHSYIVRCEFPLTPFLGTALIDLYGKCGHLDSAEKIFAKVREKKACTWNAVMMALACNGRELQALDMFDTMTAEGILPNGITFVAALTACARARIVDVGLWLFDSMFNDYGCVPSMEHYGCVVDLYGRAGLLQEAMEFIKRMPFEPDASVLGALLGACKVHGDCHLANELGQRLLSLQPWHSGRYMVLSNIYAGAGMWETAATLKQAMLKEKIKKIAGYSLLEAGCN